MTPPPREPLDRRPIRVVDEAEVPDLRHGANRLPMWVRITIAIVTALGTAAAGIGGSRAGLAGVAGLVTKGDFDSLTARLVRIEERVTDMKQGRRKEGLTDQQKVDFANLLEAEASRLSLTRAKKKLRPAADAP